MTDDDRRMIANVLNSNSLSIDQRLLLAGLAMLRDKFILDLKKLFEAGGPADEIEDIKTATIRLDELAVELASWQS